MQHSQHRPTSAWPASPLWTVARGLRTLDFGLWTLACSRVACLLIFIALCQPAAGGSWLSVASQPAGNIGEMLLLSDGSVMCADDSGNPWYRLTPDKFGSYVNGQWSTTKPMHYPRNLFAADIVPDGRLFVAGGEYGTGITNAEIFDPQTGDWTVINPPISLFDPSQGNVFSDMISIVIPDGTVLMAPLAPKVFGVTLIYDPRSNTWSAGPTLTNGVRSQGETGWAKLADGSILTIDKCSQNSQRYIPSLGQWVPDAPVPQFIWNTSPHGSGNPGCEIGPVLTLPSGQVFFAAGTGSNALYTPSGTTNPGTWSYPAPVTPNNLLAADCPGAVMPNGKLLFMVATNCFNGGCNTPWHFYVYDNTAKPALQEIAGPSSGLASGLFIPFMLDLPDGSVLLSGHTPQLSIYVPDPPPSPIGQPTITSISANPDGSFHLVGTGLNGITEGANEGDDGQMATDYPLVRLTDLATGQVYYARTYNWSSTRIQTGATPVSTEFSVTNALSPTATYSLVVVANGVPSAPATFYGPVWVDFNTTVHPGNGTYATPYDTLAGGISAVPTGGTIFIKPGSSTETPTITKPMSIVAVGGAATVGH